MHTGCGHSQGAQEPGAIEGAAAHRAKCTFILVAVSVVGIEDWVKV
jgi:hypothetical protein